MWIFSRAFYHRQISYLNLHRLGQPLPLLHTPSTKGSQGAPQAAWSTRKSITLRNLSRCHNAWKNQRFKRSKITSENLFTATSITHHKSCFFSIYSNVYNIKLFTDAFQENCPFKQWLQYMILGRITGNSSYNRCQQSTRYQTHINSEMDQDYFLLHICLQVCCFGQS